MYRHVMYTKSFLSPQGIWLYDLDDRLDGSLFDGIFNDDHKSDVGFVIGEHSMSSITRYMNRQMSMVVVNKTYV
jgi:hypothetical protein